MGAIAVHGGAGGIQPDDRGAEAIAGCERAAQAGHAVLSQGGSALDAAEAAVIVLEDDPNFNAGFGSSLDMDGHVTMDALIMHGAELQCGAVAAIRGFKNPTSIARRVMQDTPHVLLAGEGAARFATQAGFVTTPDSELISDRARERYEREKAAGWPRRPGTVGVVALDDQGDLVAVCSTGGISGRLPGRIGDTPLVGAGAYADNRAGAASTTGHGESIIKIVMAKTATDRLLAGDHPQIAADLAVKALDRVNGEAGVILVDHKGGIGIACNAERMSRAWIDSAGNEGSGFEP